MIHEPPFPQTPSSGNDDQSDSVSYSYGQSTKTRTNDIDTTSTQYSIPVLPKFRPAKINHSELLARLFEQRNNWKKYGKLTVACKETFIIAPVKLWWWMSEIFVLVTIGVFSYEFFSVNWIVLVPAVIVGLLEWMAFYKTCMRDPGMQPKPEFVDALKNLISVLTTVNGELITLRLVAHPNGQQEKLQFCWRCYHFRSLQTLHCGTCDACMIMHDHHCPVFGGCVAKNNLSSFHTMIITMALFWLYMFGYCVYHAVSETQTDLEKTVRSTTNTTITFYLILAEIFSVITIPMIVSCTMQICRKSNRLQQTASGNKKETALEILKFAKDNNLSLEERVQLMEILKVQDPAVEVGIEIEADDENHNNS